MIRLRSSSPVFRAVLAGSVLSCLAPLVHAQTTTTTTRTRRTTTTRYGTESAVQRERTRREALAGDADTHVRAGDAAVIRQDYEAAVNEYHAAVDSLNAAPANETSRPVAIKKFFDASMTLANQRITEGHYPEAESTVKVLLRPEYDPGYQPAIKLLKHLEDPEYFNTTIGPKFVGKVQQTKQLFVDAQGFYDTGRYDLAIKRYEQILNLDPYNSAARRGQERVNSAIQKHYEEASYPETRSQLLRDVSHGWDLPVRRTGVGANAKLGRVVTDQEGTAAINRKLQSILIPNIEFRSTTVSDAIEFLRQESRRLDPDPDPERRGVNIFLKLPGTGSTVIRPVAAAAEPAIPGLPDGTGTGGGTGTVAVTPTATASTRITLTMSRLPLLEALRYVASQAGLKVKVEQYAVSIVPFSEVTEGLITATFRVSPNFITNATSGGGNTPSVLDAAATSASGGGGGGGTRDNTGAGTALISRQGAKEFLQGSGVDFSAPGASATFLSGSSQLVVRNTQDQIDLVQQLVEQQSPVIRQVEIESKFIEITQQNLKELSFDWSLGQSTLAGSSRVFFGGGTQGNGRAVTDFPFANADGSQVGANSLTSGNRSGTFGISANAIDALLFGGAGAAAAPGIFSVAGVFSDPQFQVIVRALNQQKGVDLLSAPRVTTKSGQKATIEIIREFIYPTQFQPPQIPQSVGANLSGGSTFNPITGLLGAGGSSGTFPVTPTTPTNFEKRNTGVTLEVEPVIGPDNYTIDLNLQPQVVDFDGFINYGSPIFSTSTNALGMSQQNLITANTINQPVFNTRKVSTSVSVYDGSTVVLGGLVREDIQKVNDKVPILGDVPLVGRLFRSKIDQNIKRNLIIFVTAHLIDPSGQLILSNEEEEEAVQPLNGPDYVAPTQLERIPSKK